MRLCDKMTLHKLLENLKKSGLYVFTTKDLSKIAGLDAYTASSYTYRMKDAKMIYPVEKGKFAISSDPLAVGTQLVFPSYLSFTTAFYLHDRFRQTIDRIYVVTPHKKSGITFADTRIEFVKFSPERVFGYRKHRKGDSYAFIADLEKAAVDCLYRSRYATFANAFEALSPGFDKHLLEDYAISMKSEAVIRRTGYLIERLGYKTALKPSTNAPYALNPTIGERGKFDKKWKLYVNEVLR